MGFQLPLRQSPWIITSYKASRAVAWDKRLARRLFTTFNRSGTTETKEEVSAGWSLICWRTLEMKRKMGWVSPGKEAWCLRADGTSASNWVIEAIWDSISATRGVMIHKRWSKPEADWQGDPFDLSEIEFSRPYSSQMTTHYALSFSSHFHSSINRLRPFIISLWIPRRAVSIKTSTTSFTNHYSFLSSSHPFIEYPSQIFINEAVCSSIISYSAHTIGEEGDIYSWFLLLSLT